MGEHLNKVSTSHSSMTITSSFDNYSAMKCKGTAINPEATAINPEVTAINPESNRDQSRINRDQSRSNRDLSRSNRDLSRNKWRNQHCKPTSKRPLNLQRIVGKVPPIGATVIGKIRYLTCATAPASMATCLASEKCSAYSRTDWTNLYRKITRTRPSC